MERIVEITERPYTFDGYSVWSYGDAREEVVRGAECALFERCPIRKGDGTCFCWQGVRRSNEG